MNGNWFATVCSTWLVVAILNYGQASAADKVTIDSAFNNDEGLVLLVGNAKMQIGTDNKEVNVRPIPIEFTVQAAWKTQHLEQQVVLYGSTFARIYYYNNGEKEDLDYGPQREFIRNGGPDAAGQRNDTVYVFKGCQMVIRHFWNSWGEPENVQKLGLPCKPDAAWSDGEDMIILKGDQVWRWAEKGDVSGPCPFSDFYSIHSWELIPSADGGGKSSCPDGWSYHCKSGKCYKLFTKHKTHKVARELCQKEGGDLATVRNEGEQKFLEKLIAKTPRDYHIGLSDEGHEGVFKWLDEDKPTTYTNWIYGQPDNAWGVENCVTIWGSLKMYKFGWNDQACYTHEPYICELHPGSH